MVIAGVGLSASDIAILARCLQDTGELELAEELGLGLDASRSEIRLSRRQEQAILLALEDCPRELQPLKDALQANAPPQAEVL